MSLTTAFILFAVLFVAGTLLVDAIIGFLRSARGHDDAAVQRRLTADKISLSSESSVDIVRRTDRDEWYHHLPLNAQLNDMVAKAGPETTLRYVWLQIVIFSALLFVPLILFLPIQFVLLYVVLAVVAGISLAIINLKMKAAKRLARFEAQLPDALDLMIRSLKVGHPISGAMSVIARELPDPIGTEFGIASAEVQYGNDVPTTIAAMYKRVPLQDLGFLNVVLQVQQEAGGNLVESLSGLSKVIRERFRMFRKVKSLTVDGRVSAWALSIFPLGMIVALQLLKEDFFVPLIQLDSFPFIALGIVIALILNLVIMRKITALRV